MHWKNPLHRLYLYYYEPIHEDIEPQHISQAFVLVRDRNLNLTGNCETALPEFDRERLFIQKLQETRPEYAVHLDSSANYLPGQLVVGHSASSAFSAPLR